MTDLSAAAPVDDHLDFQFPATLQGVLHQPCDIGLVLDDQNLGLTQFVHR